ncbi:MAG: hypothetical protein ABI867_43465 [Kofleriaceae bacterium]
MKPDTFMQGTGIFHQSRIIIRSMLNPAPLTGVTGEFTMLVPVLDWHDQTAVLDLLPKLAKFPCQQCFLVGALAQSTYDQLDSVTSELGSSMPMIPSESLDDGCQMFGAMCGPYPVSIALCAENADLTAALHKAAKSLGFKHAKN